MEKKTSTGVTVSAYLITYLVIVPLIILYSAYCDYIMYNWFCVPIGLPVLTLWQLYGIFLTIYMFFPKQTFIPKNRDDKLQVMVVLATPVVTVLIGLIVKTFLI